MTATEILEQVKAWPPWERRKFFKRVRALEKAINHPESKANRRARRPEAAARRLRIFREQVLANPVLAARDQERS
jgi:hypothetical protein